MRILFITHYFHPEGNAPATRVHQLTRRWARAGHDVTVITAVPNVPSGIAYEGYRNRWRQNEQIEGVDVVRVWTYLAANAGTVRRILSYLSFMLTSVVAGLGAPQPDIVIATTPQFFCGWAGRIVASLRRLPFVLEVRDLWPESIVAVGAMRSSALLRILSWLERRLYNGAAIIVTVGQGYACKLLERGVDEDRIHIVPNGVDLNAFAPDVDGSRLRAEFGLEDRFVCAFAGTIGMASGLDVIVRAAESLQRRSRDDIRIALIGDGAEKSRLQRAAAEAGLSSVVFTGRLAKDRMPEAIAAADVCLVHLKRTELFKTVLPSKIFEAAAMRRPIILGVEGAAADWLEAAQAGIAIEPENEEALVDAVLRLAAEPSLRSRLGSNGRSFVEQHHDYELLAAQYLDILSHLPDGRQAR